MKPTDRVSYFPITPAEQALLLWVRESDLRGRVHELVALLDVIAEARLESADLEQALELLATERQGEGVDARFQNLEARLRERVDRTMAEIEGRLSKNLSDAVRAASLHEPSSPVSRSVRAAAQLLLEEEVDTSPPPIPEEAKIAVRIGEALIWATTASQFYIDIWSWVIERGYVTEADLPISSGRKRYAVAAAPVHPTGKEFTSAKTAAPGFFVETNASKNSIIQRTRKLLEQHGLDYEIVVGDG